MAKARREVRIDIPDKPADHMFLEQLAAVLQRAKEKGVKVYLRAENKRTLPSPLRPFAIGNPFVVNPVVLIDKRIVWFGMPGSDAQFNTEAGMIPTKYRPVIRFEGPYTATCLYGFVEMSKTIDQDTSVPTDDGGRPVTETFASYVLANKTCAVCGRPMKLQKSRKGKFFLSCTRYPFCRETEFVDVNFVEQYFYRNGKICQTCIRCGCALEAKLGKYGLYIQCCGSQKHRYKLDEI